jgi:hypothetical protein
MSPDNDVTRNIYLLIRSNYFNIASSLVAYILSENRSGRQRY